MYHIKDSIENVEKTRPGHSTPTSGWEMALKCEAVAIFSPAQPQRSRSACGV